MSEDKITILDDIYKTDNDHSTRHKVRLFIHFGVILGISIALTCAIGTVLFHRENSNTCTAPAMESDIGSLKKSDYLNVAIRYQIALVVFFVYFVIESVRAGFIILGLLPFLHVSSVLHSILFFNEGLGISAAVVLHLYRFDFAGRMCACKNVDNYC